MNHEVCNDESLTDMLIECESMTLTHVLIKGVNPCSNMGGIILGRNIHPACGMYCAVQSAQPF